MRTRDAGKEEIVKQKAIQMIVSQGIEGFGMNKLAKECGISVATLYIYYADKDDLIKKIGTQIGRNYFEAMIKAFSNDMPFAEGLRKQWDIRISFWVTNKMEVACWEVLQNSTYGEYINQGMVDLRAIIVAFYEQAIERKDLVPISPEVFRSIAFGPLFSLLKHHAIGKKLDGTHFTLTSNVIDEAFNLVLKALTP